MQSPRSSSRHLKQAYSQNVNTRISTRRDEVRSPSVSSQTNNTNETTAQKLPNPATKAQHTPIPTNRWIPHRAVRRDEEVTLREQTISFLSILVALRSRVEVLQVSRKNMRHHRRRSAVCETVLDATPGHGLRWLWRQEVLPMFSTRVIISNHKWNRHSNAVQLHLNRIGWESLGPWCFFSILLFS